MECGTGVDARVCVLLPLCIGNGRSVLLCVVWFERRSSNGRFRYDR